MIHYRIDKLPVTLSEGFNESMRITYLMMINEKSYYYVIF